VTVYRFRVVMVKEIWVTEETEAAARSAASATQAPHELYVGHMTLVSTACAHAQSLLNEIHNRNTALVLFKPHTTVV
jgi:hypothetical protein